MKQIILVVGGTGMLGEPVARELTRQGYAVRVLARSPQKAQEKLGPGFEIVPGDVEKPETLPATMQGCYGVHINLAGGPMVESYQRIEAQGTANVVRAATQAGVQRITYLSGASIAPDHAWFAPSKAKLDAESAIQKTGVAYSIFRASWFMESLPLFVQGKQAFIIGKQPAVHWLAASDYARMVAKAYQAPDAANKTFTIYGPQAISMLEALQRYCTAIRPDVKVLSMPIWMMQIMATLTRSERLKDVTRLMVYYEHIVEDENIGETNRILGAPTTSLADWCQQQR